MDEYLNEKNKEFEKYNEHKVTAVLNDYKSRIDSVVEYVNNNFPYGFRHAYNPQTKRSVFEAISVGVWLALQENTQKNSLDNSDVIEVFNSEEFRRYTHVASELHKKEKLKGRIEMIYQLVSGNKDLPL